MKIYWSNYANDYLFQGVFENMPLTFYRLENDLTGGCFWVEIFPEYAKNLELFAEVEV